MPTNGMTIDSLNTVSSLTAQDEVPVWDKEASGEPTKKITAQNMTNSVKTLGSLVNTTEMNNAIAQSTADVIRTGDVVNSLTSTSTNPISSKGVYDGLVQKTSFSLSLPSGWSQSNLACYTIGKAVVITGRFDLPSTSDKVLTLEDALPSSVAPPDTIHISAFNNSTDKPIHGVIGTSGQIKFYRIETEALTAIAFTCIYYLT